MHKMFTRQEDGSIRSLARSFTIIPALLENSPLIIRSGLIIPFTNSAKQREISPPSRNQQSQETSDE